MFVILIKLGSISLQYSSLRLEKVQNAKMRVFLLRVRTDCLILKTEPQVMKAGNNCEWKWHYPTWPVSREWRTRYLDSQPGQDLLLSACLNLTRLHFCLLQPMHLNRIFNWTAAAGFAYMVVTCTIPESQPHTLSLGQSQFNLSFPTSKAYHVWVNYCAINTTKVSCINGRSPLCVLRTACSLNTTSRLRDWLLNFSTSLFVISLMPATVKQAFGGTQSRKINAEQIHPSRMLWGTNYLIFALVGCGSASGFEVTLLYCLRRKEEEEKKWLVQFDGYTHGHSGTLAEQRKLLFY